MMDRPEDVTLAGVQDQVKDLSDEVRALREATKELVEAWKTAGSVVRFVKWLSTFLAAIGSLWLIIKYGFSK